MRDKVRPFVVGSVERAALARKCKTSAFQCALKLADTQAATQQPQPQVQVSAAVLADDTDNEISSLVCIS